MNSNRKTITENWLKLIQGINRMSTSELEAATRSFVKETVSMRGQPPRRMSADEITEQIQSNDVVFIGAGLCEPPDLTASLSQHARPLHKVKIHILGLSPDNPLFQSNVIEHFRLTSFFIDTPELRTLISEGQADYVPLRLSELLETSYKSPPDYCLIRTSPPDKNGLISLSSNPGPNMGKMLCSKKVFAEFDSGLVPMPGFTQIPFAAIDGFIDSSKTFQPPQISATAPLPQSAIFEAMAVNSMQWIEDGSTLQIGVGNFLPYILEQLSQKMHIGVHASFITNEILSLLRQGVFDNSHKGIFDGITITGTAPLTQDLIDFNQECQSLHFYPAEFFANPSLLGHIRKFISVTGALEVDLTGQVGSDSLGTKMYSGLGAQQDFLWGSQLSPEGKTMILLSSTLKDGSSSKICIAKQRGSGQTSSRGDIDVVVTEIGSASIKGLSIAERALAIIDVAHPKFREELRNGFFFRGRSNRFHGDLET